MPRLSDFLFVKVIGRGTYGMVHKVKSKIDSNYYVLKEIDFAFLDFEEQEQTMTEIKLLSSVNSEYVVKHYSSFMADGRLYIVMELCERGSLHDIIKHQIQLGNYMKENLIWKYFIHTLLGLNKIHECKVIHRDIKPLNIFVDKHYIAKIGDFGVAKLLSTQTQHAVFLYIYTYIFIMQI